VTKPTVSVPASNARSLRILVTNAGERDGRRRLRWRLGGGHANARQTASGPGGPLEVVQSGSPRPWTDCRCEASSASTLPLGLLEEGGGSPTSLARRHSAGRGLTVSPIQPRPVWQRPTTTRPQGVREIHRHGLSAQDAWGLSGKILEAEAYRRSRKGLAARGAFPSSRSPDRGGRAARRQKAQPRRA